MQKIAMQEYCVHCGQEQYKPAVLDISHGKHPCCWCGEMSEKMSYKKYCTLIAKQRKESTNA